MTKRAALGYGLVLVLALAFFYFLFNLFIEQLSGDSPALVRGHNRIGIVEVRGLLVDSRDIVSTIKQMRDDSSVKAVVLRINSPGGDVATSQEIFDALEKLRAAGKSLVASMGTVAASGGYYIACAADTIVCNPGTITGSIAVMMELPQTHELLSKIGVDFEVIKSGRFKDAGSPHRAISEEERSYLQAVIDDAHRQFVETVAEGRNLAVDVVKEMADGRVFTGSQALAKGLVDVLGSEADALDIAAEMIGVEGEPVLVRPTRRRKEIWGWFFGKLGLPSFRPINTPRLLYLLSY